jgi:hypothetical protein
VSIDQVNPKKKNKHKFFLFIKDGTIFKLTVKAPVIGSKPTCTLCTKFVGPDVPTEDLLIIIKKVLVYFFILFL